MRACLPALSLSLTLALAACATPPPVHDGGPLPPEQAGCNPEAAGGAIGHEATAAVVEQARIDAGARVARVLHPGQAVTMEYMEGRLNIDVNARNAIVGLRCG